MRRAIFVALLVGGCGGPSMLPPPAEPSREPPEAPDPGPSPLGKTRVYLDTEKEPARVSEVAGVTEGWVSDENGVAQPTEMVTRRPVCTTPCAVDLAYGAHALEFQSVNDPLRGGSLTVDVGGRPLAVREAMGRTRQHRAIRLGGLLTMMAGVPLVVAGMTTALFGSFGHGPDGGGDPTMENAGWACIGVGAAALVVGTALLVLGRDEVQPGRAAVWNLP